MPTMIISGFENLYLCINYIFLHTTKGTDIPISKTSGLMLYWVKNYRKYYPQY